MLAALVATSLSRPAAAASVASRVEWEAPEGCAGALELHARLSQLLGYEPESLGKLSRVRGSVVKTASGYRLVLETFERDRRSSRLFEAERCDDLTDTAALALALAIAPEPAASVASPATSLGAEPTSDTDAARLAPAEAGDLAAGAAGGDAGAAADTGSEAPSARGFAAAHALVEGGALPRLTPGVAVSAGVNVGALSIAAQGALFGAQTSSVAPGQDVEFDLFAGGLRGCWALLGGVQLGRAPRLNACACLEAGRYRGRGLGLTPARQARDLWLAAGAALDLEWPLGPALGVQLRAEPMLPALRKQYTINGSEDVHAPDTLSARLYLGLVLMGG